MRTPKFAATTLPVLLLFASCVSVAQVRDVARSAALEKLAKALEGQGGFNGTEWCGYGPDGRPHVEANTRGDAAKKFVADNNLIWDSMIGDAGDGTGDLLEFMKDGAGDLVIMRTRESAMLCVEADGETCCHVPKGAFEIIRDPAVIEQWKRLTEPEEPDATEEEDDFVPNILNPTDIPGGGCSSPQGKF